MKIAIDGYEANAPQRLGSSQVAFELLRHLEKIDHQNEYIILLPNFPLEDLPHERVGWKYKVLKPSKLWTRIALPLFLYTTKDKPEVMFSPTHYVPRFCPKNIKRVVTIFDLAYLYFPQLFNKKDLYQLKNWSRFSIEHAGWILTISQSTKRDLIKNYRVDKSKITVAHPGYDREIFHPIDNKKKITRVTAKYSIEGDYLIYLGTIQPKKNLVRLFEAFTKIVNDMPELKLVVVGKTTGLGRQAWMFEEILKKPVELGIEDRVIFTGYAPTEDLPCLISGALAFVLPSLWEGFGIPVVEAMACGTPVIVSNRSSLPEVVGQAGLLIDPDSTDQIEQAIRTVVSDQKLRIELSKAGLLQAKKYSWEKMAKAVIKIFEGV